MARTPRLIVKDKLYEIIPRTREGLPLPPNHTTTALLQGILARSQRDEKVTLCNFVYMANHAHLHVIPDNPALLPRFYGEFQKKITDAVRTLIGKRSLRLWEDRAGVIMIEGLYDAIERVKYLFCNPARAGLVNSIEEYPGVSSWKAFTTAAPSVNAEVRIECKWHPVSCIPCLPRSRCLSTKEDKEMVKKLNSSEEAITQVLVIKPFAWLQAFGIEKPDEIEAIRQSIILEVHAIEASLSAERAKKGRPVVNLRPLRSAPFMKSHIPAKRGRKIFLICKDKVRRLQLIREFRAIFDQCKRCYERVKEGIQVVWPPGTFTPWASPSACYVLAPTLS